MQEWSEVMRRAALSCGRQWLLRMLPNGGARELEEDQFE